MRYLIAFALCTRLFATSFDEVAPSTSEEILSLTSDLLIDGFVSVTSGQIFISEADLIVKGAQDVILKRTYVAPRILGRYDDHEKADRLILGKELLQLETKGWVVFPHLWAGYNRNSSYFQVRDPLGFVLEFQIEGNRGILKTSPYGCSNLKGETPSSAVDLRNIEFFVDGDVVKVIWPDGVERRYQKIAFGIYLLQNEILPNGKMIRYEYDSQDLCKISACDPTGQLIYGTIRKEGNHYVGSDGREVDLVYEKKVIEGKSKKDGFKEKGHFEFPILVRGSNPVYEHTIGYNEKTLLSFYDAKQYPISCTYFQEKNVPARIQTFSNPTASYSVSYDPAIAGQKGGSTNVIHPDGVQTIYRFNQLLLLEKIENCFEGKCINQKVFTYDCKQHITSIETKDGEGNLLLAKRFVCDEAGNATLETTEGDFGVFSIRRKFDKNRVILEEDDDHLQYAFTYLADTHLLTSKTILESGKKLRETLYFYDAAHNLIQVDEVDKTQTIFTLYQNEPHLHRIEWEEKKDWDGKLLYKIHYRYDKWGNASEEKHFDADGRFSSCIERTYNEKGELLKETNPLQENATYPYDKRGRCFYEEPFANGLTIHRTFDKKGRLLLLEEDDHKTEFFYNASDELIKKVDYLGFTTTYHYDPVHKKPDRIEEGSQITQMRYDSFGRPIAIINPLNAKTEKKYNSYGDVVEIFYPEGGKEICSYYPNSRLKSHRNPDGLKTSYSYDALGRIKEKMVGKRLTTYEYDGYNLCKTIDSAGFITRYTYDLADRKIEETKEDRAIHYGYDPLGFLNFQKIKEHRTTYTNDALGRMLTKSIDGLLETSWTYDGGGNVIAMQQGETICRFDYDSHNRCIQKIDEEGNITSIHYEKGPQILLQKIVDPMGVETITTYNSKNQLLSKIIDEQIVEEFEYDLLNQLKRQDHLRFGYTPNENQAWMEEGCGHSTNWTYTPGNLKLTKQKPDGTKISYRYDEHLLPTKIGTREFQYDLLGRLIGGTGFSRTLDPFGNILREEWTNGLWIESSYDELDRPLTRKLPDSSWIAYDYEGPFLKKVTRFSKNNEELYSHSYELYDAKGNPKIEKGLFQTNYEYDLKGRLTLQNSPYFFENIRYNASGNLIQKGHTTYTYDYLSQMTSELDKFVATYDSHYNLREFNGQPIAIDGLNQIVGMPYDLNGNLLKPGFVYDAFDQLVEVEGEHFSYDALGRRMQKGQTSFLYIGDEEIGAFEQGVAKELKIPGLASPIAIEIQNMPYAPIVDVQGVVRSLISWKTKEIFKKNDCDAFGVGLTDEIPYAYAGKRYDATTGLIYFGKRYYNPALRRWLTPDPIGPTNHSNLYQYLFNNPQLYRDNNGEFAFAIPLLFWGAELALPVISVCITSIVYGATAGAVVYGGYKLVEKLNTLEYPSIRDPYSRNLTPGLSSWSYMASKRGSVDPTLPANPDDLLKRPGWKETTHPNASRKGHRTFKIEKTGEELRHDEGKPGESGHERHDHYHRPNPNTTSKRDEYLDHNYNPVARHSDSSHLYTPENVWWNK